MIISHKILFGAARVVRLHNEKGVTIVIIRGLYTDLFYALVMCLVMLASCNTYNYNHTISWGCMVIP